MKKQIDFEEQLIRLFEKHFNEKPCGVGILPPSGSQRRYIRFTKKDKTTVLGAYNPDRAENNTFFYFTRIFLKKGLSVPEILDSDQQKRAYLIEDVGEQTLFDILSTEGHSNRVKTLLKKAIDQLVRFHWQTGNTIDYSLCFASSDFDRHQIFADLLYFKYYFADVLQIDYNKSTLLEELSAWSKDLAGKQPKTFMYRDFQSRNILVKNEELSFIDYQGGMLGLPEYDLAALLWQARARFPKDWKEEMVNYYFTALANIPEKSSIQESDFRRIYLQCVLLRMLQTLGAYGFRGLIQRKQHFLKSIAPALQQLADYLEEYPQYPHLSELRKVLEKLVRPDIIEQFSTPNYLAENVDKLQVSIFSFSYKKGLPIDDSGHGGGYVFDCRGILNPGRLEAFKALTGRDKAVIDFLEKKTKMLDFLTGVYSTVDISVSNYLERGFDRLSVAFGCTGGQHRSVYAAEALAKHLKEQFGLQANVIHIEQENPSIKRR